MSIEVIYQGLTIARDPRFRLQDGGVFVELDGPMPVATQLSLTHGEHALRGRVRRVAEGTTGAGMLIVPTETHKLPRWLLGLGPTSITNVELEPEPAPIVVEAKPAPVAESKPAVEPAASAEAGHEAGEPAAASGHTPSEHGEGAKDDEGDDKSGAKHSTTPAANAKKKKPRKR
jgi:hypothetical protein